MTDETGEWFECIVDRDYEIYDQYPYPIRRKGSDKSIKECSQHGYIICVLNRKNYKKHRIIAQQFIPNDDPEHKIQVDHINHNKADNRLENLRWVSVSENQRNKSSYRGYQFNFLNELPETAEPLLSYGGHNLNGLFVDDETQKLYQFNGVNYRELIPYQRPGWIYYGVYDMEGQYTNISHNVLFG